MWERQQLGVDLLRRLGKGRKGLEYGENLDCLEPYQEAARNEQP
jgi:hypothetical protein